MKKILKTILSKYSLPHWYVFLFDSALVLMSGYVSAYLFTSGDVFANYFWQITRGLSISLLFYMLGFKLFHTYQGIIRFSSFYDLRQVLFASLFGGTASAILAYSSAYLLPDTEVFNSTILFPDAMEIAAQILLSIAFMWSTRIAVKVLYEYLNSAQASKGAFIYGIHDGGMALAKSIRNADKPQFKLLGFISPSEKANCSYLMGVNVYPCNGDIIKKMIHVGASAVLVSPLQTDKFLKEQALIDELTEANIQIFMAREMESLDAKSEITQSHLKEVEIEDLLPRKPIQINMDAIEKELTGQCILITGAAGSIGSEIVKQVCAFKPSQLVLIDQAETPMHDLSLILRKDFSDVKSRFIVGSITDEQFIRKIFSECKPNYIFHAAAYKHVPMMENNPEMAVLNNIRGTRIIADLAVEFGTKKFVMISTDKAVNPTNVMGCSKRICEIYCQSLSNAIAKGKVQGNTQFVTTRFGNVLGSNGSVIPLFKKQILEGGPITVTNPNIIRYFMLIPEACKLVLEAGVIGKGGEIFVFDMGSPVKIVDLAKRMIALSGAKNIEIQFTGLRDGEKLFEEILADKELVKPTFNPQIFIASVREYDYERAKKNEYDLVKLAHEGNSLKIVRLMQKIVPEYQTTNEKYK